MTPISDNNFGIHGFVVSLKDASVVLSIAVSRYEHVLRYTFISNA